MAKATRRYMRLLVFFDLPTVTKQEKRAYTLFRRFLLHFFVGFKQPPF